MTRHPENRILIVEDEKDIRELISYHLTKQGYQVSQARSAEEAMASVLVRKPSLIVLDLMLPKMSGLEFCKRIKQDQRSKEVAILMLTAKSDQKDIVAGLEMGADDYVTKPFNIDEVMARVKAVLRRVRKDAALSEPFSFKQLQIDWSRHKIFLSKRELKLTLTEFNILKALTLHQGHVLTRNQLLDLAMGEDTAVVDRTVDVHIQSLRKKMGGGEAYIETVRGIGYRFRDN